MTALPGITVTETAADLAPSLQGALALAETGASLDEVVSAALGEAQPAQDVAAVPERGPAPIELTEDALRALRDLHGVWGRVNPERLGRLSEADLSSLGAEDTLIRTLLPLLERRKEAIREILYGDWDAQGSPALAQDAKGHRILAGPERPVQTRIPGTNKAWSQEYAGPVEYDDDELAALQELYEISPAVYRALTSRRFDPRKARARLLTHPAETLGILHRIARVVPRTSLHIRAAK